MADITLSLDNTSTSIEGRLNADIYKSLRRALGYQPEDALWRQQQCPWWDGWESTVCGSLKKCRCAIKKDGVHFPTGLISKAVAFFRENNISFELQDIRDPAIANAIGEMGWGLSKGVQLYPYQRDAVDKALSAQRGIIKIATGGGKTITAAGIIAELSVSPTIFYVTSNDLLVQAKAEIEKFVSCNNVKLTVGAVGGGQKKIADITVMTVQTAIRAVGGKYIKFDDEDENDTTDIEDIKRDVADLIRSAKLIICDEVQHWRAETCQQIADNSLSCRWRYGLSATPWRDAGDDILIDACFGRPIVDIPASYLIREGFLVKPYIQFVTCNNFKGQKLGPWQTTYKTALVENDYRNNMIATMAQRLVDMGRTVLVLVQQINHGECLNDLIPGSVFLHGQSGKKTRKTHIDRMRQGHCPITISSTIFDEGIDVRPLDALILAGGGKSPTRALQRIGRVIRLYDYPDGRKKTNAFVYDFWDHQKYLTQHAMARLKIYRSESEFEIKEAT